VKQRELGEVEWLRITRTSWAPHHHDPDAAWGMLAQNLSIALEILGGIPEPLLALPEIHQGNVLGVLAVLGETPRVVIEDSMRYSDNRREIRLHCADGIVVLPDMTSGYIEITRNGGTGQHLIPEPERRSYAPEPPLLRELKAFLEHTQNRRKHKPHTSVAEGLAIVQATDQLRKLAGC
jgi:predicted dehydrogenase